MADNIPSLEDLIKSIQEDGEDIPGLDDLLDDIRSEGAPQSSSALAVVPKKEDDLVEEDIDSQILSILGLEDVFDLTYEEYYRELRTAAAAGRMPGSQMSTESIELVTEELKRVKGKTGRFKVKPKKIDINKVLDRKQPTPPGAIVKAQKLIPSVAESAPEVQPREQKPAVDVENLQDDLLNGIGNILESLITIRTVLQSQSKTEQQAAKEDRKETEKKKKKEREAALEKKKPKSPILKALTKPVDDFFGAIKRFFTNVLLGSVVLGLFKWLKDPKNKKAIDDFTNFLENNAGLILGGLLAIAALPLASTILSLTGAITGIAIPAIKAAFAFLASPVGLAALAAIAVGTTVYGLTQASKSFEEHAAAMSDEELDKQTKRLQSIVSKQEEQGYQSQGESSKDKNYLRALEAEKAKRERVRKKTAFGQENIDKALKRFEQIKTSGSGEKIKIPGVGTMQAGKNFFGTPQVKYFDESGNQILKHDFDKLLNETVSIPQPQPQPQTPLAPDSPNIRSGPDPNATFSRPNKSKFSSFFGSKESFRKKAHEGIDDPIPVGTELSFNQSGKILDVYRTSSTSRDAGGGYGQFVKVQLDDGKVLLMAHLSEISSWVKNGAKFNANDLIAKSGGAVGSPGSGRSGGPHLHFEQHNTPGLGLEETLRGKVDPIQGGGIAALQYGGVKKTGKVEIDSSSGTPLSRGEVARTPVSTPSIPSPTGRGNIVPLPIPTGGGTQQASSGTSPNQAPVPRFSSEDPNNTTTMVVRAIYNIVG